jgi:NNP family nitrate/nitrite transporter-like MFS transporter
MGAILLAEGLALMLFSRMDTLLLAIGAMLVFSLCVQMSEGATYSVVPFVNKRALGSVAGIVGAGGNAGAVAAGFLFRSPNLSWPTAFLILGGVVTGVSALSLVVRFAPENVEEGSRVRSDDEDARERVRGWIPETVPAQEVG